MAQPAFPPESPTTAARRPKGILKNSGSYQQTSPEAGISAEQPNISLQPDGVAASRPGPQRELSEREITQANTEINAGNTQRRNSSNQRGGVSRRQSQQGAGETSDESNMRLKWDEANLYLNEGQMGGRMKITEPKTPFAKNYDPMEDEEEVSNLNAEELAVDELDMEKARSSRRKTSGAAATTSDIPGLDLGEPKMEMELDGDGERRVHVDENQAPADTGHHGENSDMNPEELEKHKKFEEMRKKHYEMRNVKDLLGHPENLDELEDDE